MVDIDTLNGLLYEAVKAGYVEIGPCCEDPDCACGGEGLWMKLTERGWARARTLALAQNINLDAEDDSIAAAISLASYGFLYLRGDDRR